MCYECEGEGKCRVVRKRRRRGTDMMRGAFAVDDADTVGLEGALAVS